LRVIISQQLEKESEDVFNGEFGGIRKGKRGRGAGGKVPVFGFLKRGGRVYTKIIPDI
jgi:transposase